MLMRLSATPITTCPVATLDLQKYVACLDPNQAGLIASLGLAATQAIENYLGDFIIERSIRWVASRGETERTDGIFRSWLSSRSYVAAGFNCVAGQWYQFPTAANSVQGVTLGVWGMDDWPLTLGQDYAVDLMSDPAKITFTWNLAVQDMYINFDHMVVDYTGGIAATADAIPQPILIAIKILTKKLFDNRDTSDVDLIDKSIEFLLCNYRRFSFGDYR